jgi:8-oxo-dGTP diphosphatase
MVTTTDNRFNIRLYGIWISNGRLLVNEEIIRGRNIVKFPGGGLQWGEGTTDCLRREFMEELGISIIVGDHFYTTDFFQASAYDNSQVISIYYRVTADPTVAITNLVPGERTFWIDLASVSVDTFTLPIDKIVGAMISTAFNTLSDYKQS